MAKSSSEIRNHLLRLSEPIEGSLSKTLDKPPEGTTIVSVKSTLEALLPHNNSQKEIRIEIRDFCLCCAALASVEGDKTTGSTLSWIPIELSASAEAAFGEVSKLGFRYSDGKEFTKISELGVDNISSAADEQKLVIELLPEVLPLLKETIKGSSIDGDDEGNEVTAACAREPVAYAILAAYQLRWFVTQVDYPHLGKLCSLVIPCALTALDHWSPEVKGQAMVTFIHLAKNVNASELCWYEDVILDICCRNIASSDELWHLVVEMSVLMVTCIQRNNPRSSWFERMMNDMLSHLERQPRNKDRRIEWLELIEPVFNSMGLVLLVHFGRIFPLLFQWMHADDDKTVLLVLERIHTILKLTWIRNTPYIERLVDELAILHKGAALRRAREEIRGNILHIFILLQKCKELQFETAWEKHKDDPNLSSLSPSLCKMNRAKVAKDVDHVETEVSS